MLFGFYAGMIFKLEMNLCGLCNGVYIWMFPKIGGKPPKWKVYNEKTLLKLMIWGFSHIFGSTPIFRKHFCVSCYFRGGDRVTRFCT